MSMADDFDDKPTLEQLPEWLNSWNYPTRVTHELAIRVAIAISRGADLKAAGMLYGVAPSRLMRWLKWGAEAYAQDADGNHPHHDCLELFLLCMQATGMAAVPAQQQAYAESAQWWLSHNPDTRNGWGQATPLSGPVLDSEETTDVVQVSPLPSPSASTLRNILKTVIGAGGAIERDDTVEAVVEPSSGEEPRVG